MEEIYNSTGVIDESDVRLNDTPSDKGALKIVVQDYQRSVAWLKSKNLPSTWDRAQGYYEPQHKIEYWEGTKTPKANVSYYTVAKHVKSIEPQIMNGLFSDDPPFMLNPRPSVSQNTARAVSALLHYQIEDCNLQEEVRLGVRDCLTFGTAIWKWGWESFARTDEVYRRTAQPVTIPSTIPGLPDQILHTKESDAIEMEEIEEQVDRPTFENCDLRHLFVDPTLRVPDIRRAKYVIHRLKLSAEELDRLRGYEGYSIPSRAELADMVFDPSSPEPTSSIEQRANLLNTQQAKRRDEIATVDALADAKFEVLERWDNNKVVAVLNQRYVIRNEKNPYRRVPFVSVAWWDVPNSFYGLGLGLTIGEEQQIQKGLTESHLDEVIFNLNLPYLADENSSAPTQNIRTALGKIIKVGDVNGFKPMPRLEAVPEAFAEVQLSEARAESISGANELVVQGQVPQGGGRSSITRTATGVNALAGGSSARLEAFVERLGDQVFEPTLLAFHEMNRRLLPLETLRAILDEELAGAYEGDHLDILNARVAFDVLAAARMQQRRTMAQSLPILIQNLVTDPTHQMLTQQGKKVNICELVSMLFEVSGWKNKRDVIVDMTPDDEQRALMSNPGYQKMMADKARIADTTQSKLSINDAENNAKAYRDVQRVVLESATKNMAVNGEPGDEGFGSQI